MPLPAPVLDHVVIDVRDQIDEAMRCFAAIPGSRLLHLHHNKHELTWVHLHARG